MQQPGYGYFASVAMKDPFLMHDGELKAEIQEAP